MSITTKPLSSSALRDALEIRDLTDPMAGPHAIQLLIDEIEQELSRRWSVPVRRERSHPIVSVAENYDHLLVPADAVARDARYTRYVSRDTVLRTHTSALIPSLLVGLAADPALDALLSCPGMCYRRDTIDRLHVGEPHQLDLWRIRTVEPALDRADLLAMIGAIVDATLPGRAWRTVPTGHPYTDGGVQIDVDAEGTWVEIGECGTARPELLRMSGLSVPPSSGLAMGLGLDRLLMVRKGIDDIRLLRASDARVARQMLDLEPYRAVSLMPPLKRDLSIAVDVELTGEELGDRIREALGDAVLGVEAVTVVSETAYEDLPAAARTRLGMHSGQKNVLLRIVIRHLERTLTDEEGNRLRDRIYAAIHEGDAWMWSIDHGK